MGQSPFEVEVFNIDVNGNHRLYYNGFNRYEMIYMIIRIIDYLEYYSFANGKKIERNIWI
jgi:hypothetical protein